MRTAVLCAAALAMAAMTPARAAPAFKHIIIIVQENRTTDNLFGSNPAFEPGVDIASSGVNSAGRIIPLTPVPLGGCYDVDHTHGAFLLALLKGADQVPVGPNPGCVVPANPQFKYVDNRTGTVEPYFDIARNYGFANRMFQTNQGPSFPAHQFLFGGTSSPSTESALFASENPYYKGQDSGCEAPATQRVQIIDPQGRERKPGVFPCFTRPTMAELLDHAGISWTYYAPLAGSIWTAPNAISQICQAKTVGAARKCTGPEWTAHVVPNNPAQILTDITSCALSGVSWVIPTAKESDHAARNDGSGPDWVASIVNALGEQPACAITKETYWNDTAILITWDDWGGWYDHVKPFAAPKLPGWGAGYTYGFRVPLLVVSAYTAAHTVSNALYDFGSLLYFTEQNFGLGYIGPGDTVYSQYADYHAAPRGPLSDFFTLSQPRAFVAIPASQTAASFLRQAPSDVGPDDD